MRYRSRLDPVYEHVNGDSGRLCIPIRGEKQSTLSDGLMTLNIQMHISWRAEKQATIWVNRRVNTLWTERQTTPRSG